MKIPLIATLLTAFTSVKALLPAKHPADVAPDAVAQTASVVALKEASDLDTGMKDRHLGYLKSVLISKKDEPAGVLGDVVVPAILRSRHEKNAKSPGISASTHTLDSTGSIPHHTAHESSTSFWSDITVPINVRSLLEKKVNPASVFDSSQGVAGSALMPSDSNRLLQVSAECFQFPDGSLACVQENSPASGYATFFYNCPSSLSSFLECGSCGVLAEDNTPDTITDNPVCTSCTICSSTAGFAFDCSNLAAGDCVAVDCDGNCFSGPSGGSSTPAPSLPAGCVETDQGVVCFLVDEFNYTTFFVDCPATLTGPRDCSSCIVIGPDGTPDDIQDNPTCTTCSVCTSGTYEYAFDCSNLLTDCPSEDCDGNCVGTSATQSPISQPSTTPSPLPQPPASSPVTPPVEGTMPQPPASSPVTPPIEGTMPPPTPPTIFQPKAPGNNSGGRSTFVATRSLMVTAAVAMAGLAV